MKRPNILILYTDQQRWDALGASGNREIRTPHMDRLAAEGLNFDHCFVQNPVCAPSRVSFLSGRYPSALGIVKNGVPVPADLPILPHYLRNYGYRSANIGKLHFLPHANRDHRQVHPAYGFDHLEISDEPGCYEDAYRGWVRRKHPDQLDHVSVGLPPAAEAWHKQMQVKDGIRHPAERCPNRALVFPGRSDCTHTAFVAEQTGEYLRANAGRPWLCVAGFYSPHSPWIAPSEFLDLYDPAKLTVPEFPADFKARIDTGKFSKEEMQSVTHGYYAMVSEVDHHVGRILATLDETGVADDTIVVFTADHGEFLGEYLRYGKGYPSPDCISRVPMIVRWPRGFARCGRTVDGLIEAVDVLPTLLEWAGIPVPGELQGESFASVAAGEFSGRASALTEDRHSKALRTQRHRYILHADGREKLFDLQAEEREYHDVAGDPAYAAVLADLRKQLAARLIAQERYAPRAWAY